MRLCVKFKKSIGKTLTLKPKVKMNPPRQRSWPSPPSFGRRINVIVFQINKSVPACGESVGKADKGDKVLIETQKDVTNPLVISCTR